MGKKKFQNIANTLLPENNIGEYNQAIMDFGSIHCKKNSPKCTTCPLKSDCKSHRLGNVMQRPVKKSKQNIKTRYFNYLFINQNKYCIIQKRNSASCF